MPQISQYMLKKNLRAKILKPFKEQINIVITHVARKLTMKSTGFQVTFGKK